MPDKIIYAISSTGSNIILSDLNKQIIPYNESILLSDLYPLFVLREVLSLKTYIASGNIVINNGATALSINDAIIYIYGGITPNSNISNCISYVFAAGQHGYYEIAGSTYAICTRIKYLGTILQGSPTSASFVIETGNTSSSLQIWDITNNKQILLTNLPNTNSLGHIHTVTTFTNLPANTSIFELREKSTSGSSKLYSMDFQF